MGNTGSGNYRAVFQFQRRRALHFHLVPANIKDIQSIYPVTEEKMTKLFYEKQSKLRFGDQSLERIADKKKDVSFLLNI